MLCQSGPLSVDYGSIYLHFINMHSGLRVCTLEALYEVIRIPYHAAHVQTVVYHDMHACGVSIMHVTAENIPYITFLDIDLNILSCLICYTYVLF